MHFSTLIRTRLEHVRNERRTRAQIEARQLKKFRRLAAHAARHAPYYRDVVDARGIDLDNCVPQDFPVLTKDALLDNFDRIVTDPTITYADIAGFLAASKDPFELYRDRYYVVQTSGISGTVGYFVYDFDDWARGVAGALRVNPPSFGKRRLAFFGYGDGHYTGVSFATSTQQSLLRWVYDIAAYHIDHPLGPILDSLNAFQPTILMGYPSALGILADAQLQGRLTIAPQAAQCSGESVLAADRAKVEQAFGVPLVDVYSSTEHLIMGANRPEYGCMHLFEDNLIFELKEDHTLITNLFNRTMPLIRYRMNDMLTSRSDHQGVLPFTAVQVAGRSEHTPTFLNEHGKEDFIHAIVIADLLIEGVRCLQLEVVDRTSFRLRICLERGLDASGRRNAMAASHQAFDELLAQKEMRNVSYQVEVADELPVDPKTGKFRLVVPARAAPDTVPRDHDTGLGYAGDRLDGVGAIL